jgi:hypothetical protein
MGGGVVRSAPQDALAAERYKTFPPKWAHIQVPVSSRGAARSALALYAPCLRRGYAVRDAAWLLVSAIGPHALPGRHKRLQAPLPAEQWQALLDAWQQELGTFDSLALHSRPQEHRSGFAVLLLREGRSLAFVRVRKGHQADLTREQHVLGLCAVARPVSFWHPEALAGGNVGEWSYLATTAFPSDRHVAGRLPIADVLAEIGAALAPLPRDPGTPPHWVPMHGDLTPWNCRDLTDGRRALIDWEDAAWGPAGADEVLFRATVAALSGGSPGPGPAEAVAFWQARLARRPTRRNEPIGQLTLNALRRMEQR